MKTQPERLGARMTSQRFLCWSTFRNQAHGWGFWFRIFGYGLYFANKLKPCFSERMGITPYWIIFGVKIAPLKPRKPPRSTPPDTPER